MPAELTSFAGTVLVAAPHMDDEVLACGGLIARLPDPAQVHVLYATDGMQSPAPVAAWQGESTHDLGELRRRESEAAMGLLGVPTANLHFLNLPEAELSGHENELGRAMRQWISSIDPDLVLAPFRCDRHPDHLAVNRVVTGLKRSGELRAALFEYFVYHRSRLLPLGDVRAYLRADCVLRVDIAGVAGRKRAALDCFRTQTTRFFDWQTRPILQAGLLDEECAQPEQFLRYDPSLPGDRVFTHGATWIRVAQRIEPTLVRWKYVLKTRFGRP
jgi:LmbE family N-acetylglucosaminyl deacetylase